MTTALRYEALLFDKDGTLVDFAATWDAVVGSSLRAATANHEDYVRAAVVIGYDHEAECVLPASPFVAEPWTVVADLVGDVVDLGVFAAELQRLGAGHAVAMPGLDSTLRELRSRGCRTAVVTNDAVELARRQLAALGTMDLFDLVLGFDSVVAPKPAPDMMLTAAGALDVDPQRCLVIGDSAHDLAAARRAGMDSALIGLAPVAPEEPTFSISALAELLDV